MYLQQVTFRTPTATGANRLPEVPLTMDLLCEVILLVTLLMDLLPDVLLLVDLLPPHPPDLHQLLPSEVTGGEVTLVAGIRVGNSTRQTVFHVTPEIGEIGRKRGSPELTCLLG